MTGFVIQDDTAGVNRFVINSMVILDIAGNVDFGAGIDVTGLATVTKTTSSEAESILEVKHGNLTQGIGFGFNRISAIGSNTNVDLKLPQKVLVKFI
ncbi:MAG: hypothetical protein CM15mV71_360 [Caudoviricetes sp.]|nr:MAG: hypothetical protein CM15mV71_360 [Caudoviricetes sp.]